MWRKRGGCIVSKGLATPADPTRSKLIFAIAKEMPTQDIERKLDELRDKYGEVFQDNIGTQLNSKNHKNTWQLTPIKVCTDTTALYSGSLQHRQLFGRGQMIKP